jgi:hypothetical protein
LASRLDPYGQKPPAASADPAGQTALVREQDDLLLVCHGTRLADVCVKCASRERIVRRFVVMSYRRFWPAVWLLAGLILARFVVTFVLTLVVPFDLWSGIGFLVCFAVFWRGWRHGSLDLPVCPACDARWRAVVRARFLATLAIIPVLILSAIAADLDRPGSPFDGRKSQVAFALAAAWLLGLIAVHAGTLRKRTVGARAIHDQLIFLRGVHPDARRALVVEAATAAGVRRIPPAA